MAEAAGGQADQADLHAPGGHRLRVNGLATSYSVAGEGRPVLFLHGWGLGHRSYSRPLAALAERGCRVYTPSLPGFAGSGPLAPSRRNLAGYAEWADAFVDALGLTEPLIVVGHSFGGGVAVGLTHRRPQAVGCLALVNSIGAGSEGTRRVPGYIQVGGRPLWSWALEFGRELLPPDRGVRLVAGMWTDLAANLVTNPVGLMETGWMAARADLTAELADLGRWGVPVLAVRGQGDGVVPLPAFQALCDTIGTEGRIVQGSHSFPLTDPGVFDEAMADLLRLAGPQRPRRAPAQDHPEPVPAPLPLVAGATA